MSKKKSTPPAKPAKQKKTPTFREEYFRRMFTSEGAAYNRMTPTSSTPIERALDQAHEIRRFEIMLYWKRALYFWGFQSVLLAGLAVVLAHPSNRFFAFLLTLGGMVVSAAWYHTNLGSKFWQSNWELHIDMLEEKLTGNLHKNVLSRFPQRAYSVSRINEHVSLFFFICWALLYGYVLVPWVLPALGVTEEGYRIGLTGVLVYIVSVVGVWSWFGSLSSDFTHSESGKFSAPLFGDDPRPITLLTRRAVGSTNAKPTRS